MFKKPKKTRQIRPTEKQIKNKKLTDGRMKNDRQTEQHTEGQAELLADWPTKKQTGRHPNGRESEQKDRSETDKQRMTDRLIDRPSNRQKNKLTDWQKDIQT